MTPLTSAPPGQTGSRAPHTWWPQAHSGTGILGCPRDTQNMTCLSDADLQYRGRHAICTVTLLKQWRSGPERPKNRTHAACHDARLVATPPSGLSKNPILTWPTP
eukprot:704841-Prymnesium_polylepis.1